MNRILVAAFFTFCVSTSSFAKCTVEFLEPRDRAFSSTFISQKTYQRILKVLTDKGYNVLTEGSQDHQVVDYELTIGGTYGYGCGTGLTFKDYLKMPTWHVVKLSVPRGNTIYNQDDYSNKLIISGPKTQARRKLLKAVKNMPSCSEL